MSDILSREIRKQGGLAIAAGIVVVLAGLLSAVAPVLTFQSATIVVGALVFVAGVCALVDAFQDQGTGRKILDVLLGILSIAVAIGVMADPFGSAIGLALFVAVWLLLRGVLEFVWAFMLPYGRALNILNAIVDLFLGGILLKIDPASAQEVLGLYVAISLIFWGISLICQGSLARDVSRGL